MGVVRLDRRRVAGALGAVAGGLGVVQCSDAAVVYQPLDVNIPADTGEYSLDLNGDGITEFDIQIFFSLTKVGGFPESGEVGVMFDAEDQRTANLPLGTSIGSTDTFSEGVPPGDDVLNGLVDVDPDPDMQQLEPAGHFQVSDGPGFIGVEFPIDGNTHYGYVGYEGTGAENDASGHIFAMGYEDTPGTAIEAGAGIPFGVPGDYNNNGTVDAADYTAWRDALGGTSLTNEGAGISPDAVDQQDYEFWKQRFGASAGAGSASAAVPEPTSLCLLAAGAAGLPLYRRRRSARRSQCKHNANVQ